ncbi:hypothetical protein [Candidatus Albibeggiatoa sp. nov. NOAA]|uniref:hypothetical protein n=1 Tax=Candidatus Albibeggiatoa sp. nov. NOAA TaxID=3162724 RepID=UPI0033032B13|nr:hypothetical protein [Thiotrichaceae bacterium]
MQFFDKRFFLMLLIFSWMQQLSAADIGSCNLPIMEDAYSSPATGDKDSIALKVEVRAKALQKQFNELDKGSDSEKFEKWSACMKKLIKANKKLNRAFDTEEPFKKEDLIAAQEQINLALEKAFSKGKEWLSTESAYKTALCRATLKPLRQLSFDIDKGTCDKDHKTCKEIRAQCQLEEPQQYCGCVHRKKEACAC